MSYNNVAIVIPAYQPDEKMLSLIDEINECFKDCKMIIVNDGSNGCEHIFENALKKENVYVVSYSTNHGKGHALKCAFKYVKENYKDVTLVVTCDADGQHKVKDILNVTNNALKNPNSFVLGSRIFDFKVPFRSKFGNDATRLLYRICNLRQLNDNQTGLRAFDAKLIDIMTNTKGDRYEYEMNVLMECEKRRINIIEVGIQTVYIDNNSSSHFRPVRDFLKVCNKILKYYIPYLISLLINIVAFVSLTYVFKQTFKSDLIQILISGVISSCLSILINVIFYKKGFLYKNKLSFALSNLIFLILMCSLIILFNMIFKNVYGTILMSSLLFTILYFTLRAILAYKSRLN